MPNSLLQITKLLPNDGLVKVTVGSCEGRFVCAIQRFHETGETLLVLLNFVIVNADHKVSLVPLIWIVTLYSLYVVNVHLFGLFALPQNLIKGC